MDRFPRRAAFRPQRLEAPVVEKPAGEAGARIEIRQHRNDAELAVHPPQVINEMGRSDAARSVGENHDLHGAGLTVTLTRLGPNANSGSGLPFRASSSRASGMPKPNLCAKPELAMISAVSGFR